MSAWVPVRDPAARTGVGAVAVGLLRPRLLRQQRHPGPLLLQRGQGRRWEPARARSRPAAGGFGELSDASQCLAPGMEVGGGRDVGGDHLARSLAGTRTAVRGRHALVLVFLEPADRKSTRLNSSHLGISYSV